MIRVRVDVKARSASPVHPDDAPSAFLRKGALLLRERIEVRLRELARRAGLTDVPPAVVAGALVVFALVIALAAWRWWPRGDVYGADRVSPTRADVAGSVSSGDSGGAGGASAFATESVDASASATVWVHVVGAVHRPGVYELDPGSRVADAVEAAGGLLGDAAQAGVNLARTVSDGEQIAVPTLDEFAGGAGSAAGGTGGAPSGGAATAAGGIVNINTADAAALDTLPGVGPSTAAKIVADRQANGPFASPDDLGRVTGIGPKKLEQLKVLISVR